MQLRTAYVVSWKLGTSKEGVPASRDAAAPAGLSACALHPPLVSEPASTTESLMHMQPVPIDSSISFLTVDHVAGLMLGKQPP